MKKLLTFALLITGCGHTMSHPTLPPKPTPPPFSFHWVRTYPFSIIPGGVFSSLALRHAIQSDPSILPLYQKFDLVHTRVVRLAADKRVYVSFRKDGVVYWTRTKVLLPAGETILTDGFNVARTRCGNTVSETPRQPTTPDEPSPADLGSVTITAVLEPVPPLPGPTPEFHAPAPLSPPGTRVNLIPVPDQGPPVAPILIEGPPPTVVVPTVLVSVPESGTLVLTLLGLVLVLSYYCIQTGRRLH